MCTSSGRCAHRMLTLPLAILLASYLVPHQPDALGQCTLGWRPGDGVEGIQGYVWSMVNWDPDGGGPAPEVLVAAGRFTVAGNTLVNNVAKWDGTSWQSIGNGITSSFNGTPQGVDVSALAVFNNELIAGGTFQNTFGPSVIYRNVVRWNGSNWVTMGSGGLSTPIYSLTVHNGSLYAGGSNGITRWSGTSWGIAGGFASANGVYALGSYNGDLIAGGRFTSMAGVAANGIARWNGSSWFALGSGVTGGLNVTEVAALHVSNNILYAGGEFTVAGEVSANHIASWNGSDWSALGGGMDWSVFAIQAYDNEIVAGGLFGSADGAANTRSIAAWDGGEWHDVGEGHWDEIQRIDAFAIFDGKLVEAGTFNGVGDVAAVNVAGWDGDAWGSLGDPNPVNIVRCFAEYGDALVGGGKISPGGNNPPDDLAVRKGGQWQPFENGVHVLGNNEMVLAATTFHAPGGLELIIAGSFTSVNGVSANNIARWDGVDWLPLAGGLAGVANPQVFGLIEFEGKLLAAGSYLSADGQPIPYLAQWDGSSWQAFGPAFDYWVDSLFVKSDGSLYVGGLFQNAGGSPISRIARWNGSTWDPLGSGVDGWVYAMAEYQGDLIAAGTFDSPGSNVARWNGVSWSAMGPGLNSFVNDLVLYDGALIAGGSFYLAGGANTFHIARWNGATWQSLGSGLGDANYDGEVMALTAYAGELLNSGLFANAGTLVSSRFATWGPLCPRGDMNCDQAVNPDDASLFADALVNAPSLTTCQTYLADMNGDNQHDGKDIALFVACSLGACP